MRGRPATYNDREVLEKAQQVFWKKGYTATSMDDLLTATGMGSGSFYNTFKGGKKELFRKALQQRREAFDEFKTRLKESDAPLELIRDFFRSVAREDKNKHMQGCIVANTVMEMAGLDEELGAEATAILRDVEKMFSKAVKTAQERGQIANRTDAVVLGRYLITLWNGLNVTRRMYPDTKVLRRQIDMQLEVLG